MNALHLFWNLSFRRKKLDLQDLNHHIQINWENIENQVEWFKDSLTFINDLKASYLEELKLY